MRLGDYNRLELVRRTENGVYLADEDGLEVLLPKRYAPDIFKPGELMEVFIYRDNEDRLIATTDEPFATVHQLAFLKVKSNTEHGAFLDLGLSKDLFVPKKEQLTEIHEGDSLLVFIYIDNKTDRLVASARLDRFMSEKPENLSFGDEVNIWVWQTHSLGFRVIVDEEYLGMVYNEQLFEPLSIGDQRKAYVNKIREDGKIDVILQKPGFLGNVDESTQSILNALNEQNGFLPLTDKSSPEEIAAVLNMSKKSFKKAIGGLYKQRKIKLEKNGIRLLNS